MRIYLLTSLYRHIRIISIAAYVWRVIFNRSARISLSPIASYTYFLAVGNMVPMHTTTTANRPAPTSLSINSQVAEKRLRSLLRYM